MRWVVTRKFRGKLTYFDADRGVWTVNPAWASVYHNGTVARAIAFTWGGEAWPVELGVSK